MMDRHPLSQQNETSVPWYVASPSPYNSNVKLSMFNHQVFNKIKRESNGYLTASSRPAHEYLTAISRPSQGHLKTISRQLSFRPTISPFSHIQPPHLQVQSPRLSSLVYSHRQSIQASHTVHPGLH